MLTFLALAALPALSPQATRITPPPGGTGFGRRTPTFEVLPASLGFDAEFGETHVAFFVHEGTTGSGTDLNGDGDTLDRVAAYYDKASGVTTTTALDGRSLELGDGFLAVAREEADSGLDHDSNGQIDDAVGFVIDLTSGAVTNLGVETLGFSGSGGPFLGLRARPAGSGALRHLVYSHATGTLTDSGVDVVSASFANDEGIAWIAPEGFGSGGDLNGDGDLDDFIAVMLRSDLTTFVSSESPAFQLLALEGTTAVFRTREDFLGRDLDLDGDQTDQVALAFDFATRQRRTLGVTFNEGFAGFDIEDGVLFLLASEGFHGDLNGDGDTDDGILAGRPLVGPGIESAGVVAFFRGASDGRALIFVDEAAEGADHNGDGDLSDRVATIWDRQTGSLTSLGSGGDSGFPGGIGSRAVGFEASELANGVDRNGDGDMFDSYVEAYDLTTGAPVPFSVPSTGRLVDSSDFRAGFPYLVLEFQVGDQNGDGDTNDRLLFVYDADLRRAFNTGFDFVDVGADMSGREIFFISDEEDGVDLNGDGDANFDRVLVRARF